MSTCLPSDRDQGTPDVGVGVDTVAVLGPTTEALVTALREQRFDRTVDWQTGEMVDTPRMGFMTVPLGEAWARLAGFRRDDAPYLRVEVSLPTMLHGHNRNALSLDLLPDGVDAALTLLSEQLPDVPALDSVRLARIDLPRDFFEVRSTSAVLRALHLRHVAYATVNDPRYVTDGSGRMQTLTRGSPSEYLVRGYDKAHELAQRARRDRDRRPLLTAWSRVSRGQLRFEAELRGPMLRRKGIYAVHDATPDRLEDLAHELFVRARWADPYGGRGRVQRELEALRPSLSAAEYRNLICYVYLATHDMEMALSRNVMERVRPLARRHNLLDPDDDHERRRLDFTSGREVPVA